MVKLVSPYITHKDSKVMTRLQCSTLMIASPSSGQGKTTFTAALARAHVKQGRKVAIFKMGPDYLDSMIHELASGQTVYNLDLWMMGEQHCQELLYHAAQNNDVILIESLMGLHDNQPSSAEFARLFDIPIVLLLNVAKYAQTAAAIVHGLQHYTKPSVSNNKPLNIFGVVGNRVGSENHHLIIKDALAEQYLGSFKRDEAIELPQRHLGLVQAAELKALNNTLDYAADKLLSDSTLSKKLLEPLPSVHYLPSKAPLPQNYFKDKTIAIAKDAAFSFIYAANIDYLVTNGAALKYFSPLKNEPVPSADMLWLPGGYPELYLNELTVNSITKQSVRQFCQQDKAVLAECGGLLYLLDSIRNQKGETGNMCGVISGKSELKKYFQGIGLQTVEIDNAEFRGHSFHHSVIKSDLEPAYTASKQDGTLGEGIYKIGNITASYMHFYFSFKAHFTW